MDSGANFYAVCAQALRSAQLGQFGPAFTPDQLRANLTEQARAFDRNWSDWPYGMVSPGVDSMNAAIDLAVQKYSYWLASGRPAVP